LGIVLSNDDVRIGQLQAFLKVDPGNIPLACDLLDAYIQNGAFDDAIACIESLPEDSRKAPGICFRSAQIALSKGRYHESIQILQRIIAEGNEGIALWHDLAFAQLCIGNLQDAVKTLSDAESKFGPDVDLAVLSARVNLFLENYEQALGYIEQALSLDRNNPAAMGLKALILLDMDNLPAASDMAHKCLVDHPDQHEALLTAGTLSLWRQNVVAAEEQFTRALSRFPNSGRALSGLGQVFMLRNDLPQARVMLEKAVLAMPDHIGTWHALAWAQLLLSDIDAAEASYLKAYELDRNFADSHGGLALIHALKGRTDSAEQAVKRAFRLNPDCATAIYAQSLLLSDAGNITESEALIRKLMLGNPSMQQMNPMEFATNLRKRIQP
jgi:tetratricopeptide (TPR) repeat protein